MKLLKFKYIIAIVLLVAVANVECSSNRKMCKGMRFYRKDVKQRIAG